AELYPMEYFKSLISKSEACKVNKKYNTALQFYDRAGRTPGITDCEQSDLLARIADIYYSQQNYVLAAENWYHSYLLLSGCTTAMPQKLFLMKQGELDNAGLA